MGAVQESIKGRKIHFFNKAKSTSILSYIDMDSDAITVVFDKNIVDNIISKLFFCADDESEALSLEKSMELFTQVANTTSSYQVSIKNMKCFELSLDHTSIGLSFCQTAGVIDQHKQTFNNAKLVGLNNNLVSKNVWVGVAINLQHNSDVLKSQQVWAFSLAGDSSTHQSASYFDIQVCLCANGQLYNLHLMVVPFYDCHTSLNIATMIQCILDALLPNWQSKIIDFSTDGENTMTGWHSGVVTQINKEAIFNLMQIWCIPHQVDLLIKEASHSMHEGSFYKNLHNVCIHLRQQPNL